MAPVDLRKDYLTRASGFLRGSSSSTAAALWMEVSSLHKHTQSVQAPSHNQACPACGSANIRSRIIELKGRNPDPKRVQRSSASKARGQVKFLVRLCASCDRSTRSEIPRPSEHIAQSQSSNKVDPLVKGKPQNPPTAESTSSAKSGKKRAKARKEGLQALLDKSKQEAAPTSAAFTLMDFMKPG